MGFDQNDAATARAGKSAAGRPVVSILVVVLSLLLVGVAVKSQPLKVATSKAWMGRSRKRLWRLKISL